ncbi:hypothetical protein NGRA_1855 [Nosema granulosis]|uniref:Uncharacterized protein n=1 Tax=Nosema granulosis TaxID=83296 RepID=A0A9P6KZ71_9MICR|nr:hypothetical protein NGRA_1855 [Nosema granulosis]
MRRERFTSDDMSNKRRDNPYQYIQLVQGVLLQASINVEKCAKYYTEELKTTLLEGLSAINSSNLLKITKDFNKLEMNIIRVVERLNEEILRDTEALVTNTSNELQDSVTNLAKEANKNIVSGFNNIITSAPQTKPVTIDIENALELISENFNTLLEKVISLFKKTTALEKTLLHKIIKEKKSDQLHAITKLIHDFERSLCSHFRELTVESGTFIYNTISENTHKFVIALECLLNRVGENIASALKGCDVNIRQHVGINPASLISFQRSQFTSN